MRSDGASTRWWGTNFLMVIGILLGAVLGTFQTWSRFKMIDDSAQDPKK